MIILKNDIIDDYLFFNQKKPHAYRRMLLMFTNSSKIDNLLPSCRRKMNEILSILRADRYMIDFVLANVWDNRKLFNSLVEHSTIPFFFLPSLYYIDLERILRIPLDRHLIQQSLIVLAKEDKNDNSKS